MRKLILMSASIVIAIVSFWGGLQFGLSEGANQYLYANGLLRAEQARRILALADQGNIEEIKKSAELDLTSGLRDHYALIHYKHPLILKEESKFIFRHDKKFMARILDHLSDNRSAVLPKWDPRTLPESTEEEREFKRKSIDGQLQFDREVNWVLSHYGAP